MNLDQIETASPADIGDTENAEWETMVRCEHCKSVAGLNEVESLRVFLPSKEVRQGHKGMGSADRVVDHGFFDAPAAES